MLIGCQHSVDLSSDEQESGDDNDPLNDSTRVRDGKPMQIHYLEIVTPESDALCEQNSALHGVNFSAPDPNLGGARTAKLNGDATLGIRGPLRDTETPVVRPYMLVEDIEASVSAAADAGAEIALPPMKLPGHGTCAIVIQGGIECGFWQL